MHRGPAVAAVQAALDPLAPADRVPLAEYHQDGLDGLDGLDAVYAGYCRDSRYRIIHCLLICRVSPKKIQRRNVVQKSDPGHSGSARKKANLDCFQSRCPDSTA